MKELQTKINKISQNMGSIDTRGKLEDARVIARNDDSIRGLLLGVLDEMLIVRSRKDTARLIKDFMG